MNKTPPKRWRCRVELVGAFYARELYDERGDIVYDLDVAVRVAEALYGDGWKSVYDGQNAVVRDEILKT